MESKCLLVSYLDRMELCELQGEGRDDTHREREVEWSRVVERDLESQWK